ncbi:WD repeat-containing protein 75 [Tribolium castaneum]|nr:PREDICTED: WD repeat-containing protein 75 [Tribolium castaneum]|eukprot:XP_008190612.1 PREDICTED: WD repeat-containing protein 75 [Tribolium castaneum]
MDIQVNFRAGGSFVELPPKFSSDSGNIYVAWKNEILGYSSKTGAQFVQFKGIKDRIVGFGVHYLDSYECVTACSSSGEVITWKVVTYFKLLNKKLGKKNVVTFHIVPSETNELKALISHKEKNIFSFSVFDLMTDTNTSCGLTLGPHLYHVDVATEYFAVVQKSSLNVVPFKDALKTYTFCMEKPRQFTCVACHPLNEVILTGDNTGRVLMWQKFLTTKPTKAVFHWHTLPVKCIGFSATGTCFYSGGDESVLVKWQLDNHFEKKFLPRLPSTIAQISVSPNNIFVAISTDDNAVRIVDSRLDNVSLIQHLVIGDSLESGIVVDSKSRALVMNGNVGHIQFYSPCDNSLLYNVDVVGQNKISNERSCNIENTKVSKIAISKNSSWMATIENRKDPEYSSELRLKFWNFDPNIQNYKLNTCVEDPHLNHVNAVSFQPTDNMDELKLVTVGGDKKFKVWYLSETETVNSKSQIWRCLCVGFYHDLDCKSLSFSIDGSLLAVSFNNIVTTWQPDSCNLKCALVHSGHKEEINQIEFGNSNQCHLIVAASNGRLSVWNLLTLTMIWTVPVHVSVLTADTVTTNMAVITKDNRIYVFTPISPEPVFSSDKLLKTYSRISAAVFVPSKYSNDVKLRWYQRSPIFFIDSKRQLHCLGGEIENAETPTVDEISNSLFSMTIPQSKVDKNRSKEPIKHLYQKDPGQKNLKKYLESPIQTMIPIRIMCGSLLRSMIVQKQ